MAAITIRRGDHPGAVIGVGMAGKVATMAAITIASAHRHGLGLAVCSLQNAVTVMTGGAIVMDQIAADIGRHTADCTCCRGVAAVAICRICYLG